MTDNQKPLVSIVSPIYKIENYIEECLDSMFNQTYSNIEYVFVNDNTPDNSIAILNRQIEKYKIKKVKIVNHEKNLGLCCVRKSGIAVATGEYVILVDADDKLTLDSIETLVNRALQDNADIVESDYAHYCNGDVVKVFKRNPLSDKERYIASIISMKNAPAVWGKLYKRDLFYDIDDLFVTGRDNVEDAYATPILIDRAKKISYTNKVTYYYRIDNPISFSAITYVKWKRVDDVVYSIERHQDYFGLRGSRIIEDAIKEKKYWVKRTYYLKLKDKEDRIKLMSLYPENENYIEKKRLKDRLIYYLMKCDMYTLLSLLKRIKKNN